MPKKKTRKTTKTRKRTYRAKGEGPAWDWIKDKAKKVGRFIKDKQLISKGLLAVAPLAGTFAPGVVASAGIANAVGLGKKKRRRVRKCK